MSTSSAKPCRLCLNHNAPQSDVFTDVYSINGINLQRMIHDLFSFWIKHDDEFPVAVCNKCIKSVTDFYNFYIRVKQVQKEFETMPEWIIPKFKRKNHLARKMKYSEVSSMSITQKELIVKTNHLYDIKQEPFELYTSKTENISEPFDLIAWSINPLNPENRNKLGVSDTIEDDCKFKSHQSLKNNIQTNSNSSRLNNSTEDVINKIKLETKYNNIVKFQNEPKCIKSTRKIEKKVKKGSEKFDNYAINNESNSDIETQTSKDSDGQKNEILTTGFPKEIYKDGSLMVKGSSLDALINRFFNIQCDLCHNRPIYSSHQKLFDHCEKNHGKKGYLLCCDEKLSERQRILTHMVHHLQPAAFQCPICKKKSSSASTLGMHMKVHLPDSERPYKCDQCSRGFLSPYKLKNHKMNHVPVDKRQNHDCKLCGKIFTLIKSLKNHLSVVHSELKFLCPHCGKKFPNKGNLMTHLKIHDPPGKNSAQCQHCGFVCKSKDTLRVHLKRHSEYHLCCSLCNYQTKLNSALKTHMLLKHTEEKPFSCNVCDKRFKLKIMLQRHGVKHTGERKYACSFCPKTFASSGNFYTHRKRMHSHLYKRREDCLILDSTTHEQTQLKCS